MQINVLSPDKSIFEGEVTSVIAPGVGGIFQVLNNHAPMVSALRNGMVTITKQGGDKLTFEIEKGFLEVLKNKVALLVQGVKE